MDNILLEIGGKEFYLDIDAMSEAVKIDNELDATVEAPENITQATLQIDVAKYEMYRDLVGTLLSCVEVIDDKMGIMALNSLPIPFKLSFNTLLMKGIIKEL
jgi:hypothetical protein|tara:strand:- start:3004 stop:3309 length:306 start_codon:yes stop_codon:yes gene_type:complete